MNNLKDWGTRYRLVGTVFLFALLVRLLFIAIAPEADIRAINLGFDGGDYANEATNILEGRGFSRETAEPYIPDAIRTPLYPLFLAAIYWVFDSFYPTVFIQAVLGSFTPVFGVLVAQFFIVNRRILFGVGAFLSVEPHLVFATTFFASEGLFIVLLSWGTYEIVRAMRKKDEKRFAVAGLILGLSALVRPITFYLPALLLPIMVYSAFFKHESLQKTFRSLAIFIMVFLIVLSPWLLRNYLHFGQASMSTVGWFNVYTRLAATVRAIDTKEDFYTSYHFLLDELSRRGYIDHPPPVSEREIQDPRFGSVLKAESLRVIKEHKWATVQFVLIAPVSVLTQDNTLGIIENLTHYRPHRPDFSPTLYLSQHGFAETVKAVLPYLAGPYITPYGMRLFWAVLFVLSCVGAVLLWLRRERLSALFLFGFIPFVILFSLNAGAQIDGRYRTQIILVETVLAAVAVEYGMLRRKKKEPQETR